MKGSGDKRFPVLDSRTSSLHVCSRVVSIYCMGETWSLLLPLKIFLFQTANKKSNQFKNPMPQSPFVSRVKALSAKRSEKGYGDENDRIAPQVAQANVLTNRSKWQNNNDLYGTL